LEENHPAEGYANTKRKGKTAKEKYIMRSSSEGIQGETK